LQSAKFYILAGEFVKADELIRRAMSHANLSDKVIIYDDIKKFCKNVAQDYEKELKRNHASKIYEKILEMRISDSERKEIKERLNEIYEKLGKKVSEI
jgi:predicted DNA-binding protein YlxM (UPF0122 family)